MDSGPVEDVEASEENREAAEGDAGRQNGHSDGVTSSMAIQENGTEDASLGLKRAAADGDTDIDQQTNEPASKRRKTGPPQPKNPISTLNELRPGLVYKTLTVEGPSHAPVFTVTVELNGQIFQGTGRSKKQAKHSAAEATLRSFLQFRNASDAAQALGLNSSGVQDFTSDVSEVSFGSSSTPGVSHLRWHVLVFFVCVKR